MNENNIEKKKKKEPVKISVLKPARKIDGVKPKVAEAIQKMLENGRRYFGSSGASLTQQAFNPDLLEKGINPELAKIGLAGERDTTTLLKKWIEDKPGAVLIDSAHIRGADDELDEETGMLEGGDTDHVLIIGSEVILIDSKRWKKKANYQVDDNGNALRSNKPFPGSKIHMLQAVHLWLDYLHEDASLTGIVVINSEDTIVYRNRNWYTAAYRLVEVGRFIELLDEKWELIDDYDKTHINSTLISQVAVCAVKPYDAYQRVFDMDTLKKFK